MIGEKLFYRRLCACLVQWSQEQFLHMFQVFVGHLTFWFCIWNTALSFIVGLIVVLLSG